MPNEIIEGVIATYGLPVGFGIWILWNMRNGTPRINPQKEILDSLQELKERMIAVETILEERK